MKHNILLTITLICSIGFCAVSCSDDAEIPMMEPVAELPDWEDDIPGEEYDYTLTMAPERPYMHEYDKAMLMKLFMARPNTDGTSDI